MVRKKPWSKVTDMKNVRIYAIAVFLVLALVTSCGTASMDADISIEELSPKESSIVLQTLVVESEPEKESMDFPFSPKAGDVVTFGTFRDRPLKWVVLSVEDGRALLLSKDVLESQSLVDMMFGKGSDWDSSSAKVWLEANVYEAGMDDVEKSFVHDDGYGEVFLLSSDEFVGYGDLIPVVDSQWWLRSKGLKDGNVSYVNARGSLVEAGLPSNYTMGMRPALWVDIPNV